ncbi:hypothetical protein ACOZ38_28385 [Sphaerisporangium viridialbum]
MNPTERLIRAGLNDESLPPDELADYITGTHFKEWAEFVARNQPPRSG